MYAVVKTGGRQYRVEPGQVVRVNKLEAAVGAQCTLEQVLLVKDGDTFMAGAPALDGISVSALVMEQGRAKKVIVFKKKRRQGYQKKQGHRQDYTALKILAVNLGAASSAEAVLPAPAQDAQSE